MNTGDPSHLNYRCPRCQALLTAKPEDAGTRRECPHCGKMIKVPGVPHIAGNDPQAKTSDHSGTVSSRGVANVAVTCPVCGTRMYATPAQIGQTMVCPDCLETVPVELTSPPPPDTTPQSASKPGSEASVKSSATTASGSVPPSLSADDDEFKLADEVEVPSTAIVPKDLLELVERERKESGVAAHPNEKSAAAAHNTTTGNSTASAAASKSTSPASADTGKDKPRKSPSDDEATSPPDEFRVQCPVCDTMIYASANELGRTKTCPDCYTEVLIKRPAPKPRRVNKVVEVEDDESFTLEDPADLEVYHELVESSLATREQTMLEEAEARQRERKQKMPPLPDRPLIDGVFRMLFEPSTLIRWGLFTLFLFVIGSNIVWTVNNVSKGGIYWAYAIGLGIMSLFVIVLGGAFVTVSCLAVIQESAVGSDKVESWPDLNILEWMFDGFYVMFALFYSITPGMLLAPILGCAGAPSWFSAVVTGTICFFMFPIVQLSLLEGASLTTPFTTPVLETLRTQTRLWVQFYAIVGGIILIVLVGGLYVPVNSAILRLLVCIVWAGCLLFYYRLLGRLAWACHEHAAEQERKARRAAETSAD